MTKDNDPATLRQAYENWRNEVLARTAAKWGRSLEDMPKSVYTPLDLEDHDYLRDLGFPGQYPFTRGVYPTAIPGGLFGVRQYSGFGTAEETRDRLRYLIGRGQAGFSLASDLPTQIGYDSDHPLARGEIGRIGVAIDTLEDLDTILEAFEDKTQPFVSRPSFTANSQAAVIIAMFVALADKYGVPLENITGTIQNDILKEYVARGTYIYPPRPSLKLVGDTIEFCAKRMPRFNFISISGYHIREAGASPAQEIAFTLSNGIAYVEEGLRRGLSVDDFAPRISFIFASGILFFEEVAKFRACRRIWARTMKERFGASKPDSQKLRFASGFAGSTYTSRRPLNNIIRATIECFASIAGGATGSAVAPYDEAICLPTEESSLIALDTPRILGYEAKVTDVNDPLGGSYYVEALTDQLEEEALSIMRVIEDMGGAVAAIENGYMQGEIAKGAYEQFKQMESGEKTVVGVNRFETEEFTVCETFRLDPQVEEKQLKRLAAAKKRRDPAAVRDSLKRLRGAAERDENVMEPLLDAVKRNATVGEICDVFRDVWGEYRPPQGI